jgi:cytochrome oxidase assembly protein ShyY1
VPLWLRQLAVITTGCVLAGVMLVLGVWQLGVYTAQGQQAAAARAAAPAVPLAEVAPAGEPITDGYGRSVVLTGQYLPVYTALVLLPGSPGDRRVLTAFQLEDGLVVPVVRGLVPAPSPVPAPPTGTLTQTGVLLPSEDPAATPAPPGEGGSIRVPQLAQTWPPLQGDGYVLLSAPDAAAHGLSPAPVVLPEARGRLRNAAYALQWWIFAAFAVGMAVRIAQDLGRRGELAPDPVVRAT